MSEMTFEEFCGFLDTREKASATKQYSAEERKFLWQELEHKSDDVKAAILEWAKTGKETELTIPGIIIPQGFWYGHEEAAGKPISTSMLMQVRRS